MTRSRNAWLLFILTRLGALALDTALFAAAYVAAYVLRFDFDGPWFGWAAVASSFVTVWAVQVAALVATGSAWRAWRQTGILALPRLAGAFLIAAAALTLLRYFLPQVASLGVRPPYSVTFLNALLAFVLCAAARLLWRAYTEAAARANRLLARDERVPDASGAWAFIASQTVLVTGAGGTIGSEIVRQVVRASPARVILLERSENALYEIDREMRENGFGGLVVPVLADAGDRAHAAQILAAFKPSVVLHAAAYKHVPMVEANPVEGLRNNALATRVFGEEALAAGVARFVMISTDKAVRPVGVMGATKRLAEILLMDLNGRGPTLFAAVRFGNVLGSSGSVVPLFEDQIRRRRPVTVTHPDMRRYFMTVQEAVGLVLQAATLARGGEIFVLDMGKSVRILDLAEETVRRAGLRPYVDIPIVFTGIRPGEKLFEELDVSERSAFRTGHARIFICRETAPRPADALLAEITAFLAHAPGAAEAGRRICAWARETA